MGVQDGSRCVRITHSSRQATDGGDLVAQALRYASYIRSCFKVHSFRTSLCIGAKRSPHMQHAPASHACSDEACVHFCTLLLMVCLFAVKAFIGTTENQIASSLRSFLLGFYKAEHVCHIYRAQLHCYVTFQRMAMNAMHAVELKLGCPHPLQEGGSKICLLCQALSGLLLRVDVLDDLPRASLLPQAVLQGPSRITVCVVCIKFWSRRAK